MDLNYLKKLVKIFDDSSATDLVIDEEGTKIKLSKRQDKIQTAAHFIPSGQSTIPQALPMEHSTTAPAQTDSAQPEKPAEDSSADYHVIMSPIVGTFYRAPSPESEPFAEIGSKVSQGTTLCIVEAMKLMNEIECDVNGTVAEILVNNGEAVEYNQPLFHIKKA